ncbi:MAG: hypothetical protein ACK5DG_11180 [Chitinophagaceae bacterium]
MKSIFNVFLSVCILLLTTSFKKAGSSTAYLTCKSESGRTLFSAEIGDKDGFVEKAELIVDNEKLSFTDENNSSIIFDPKNGVYTIFIEEKVKKENKYQFIKFWAIPKTFKTIINTNTKEKYEFRALFYATEPRKNKSLQTPVIEVICTLEYEI